MAVFILHLVKIHLRNRREAWILIRHVKILLQRHNQIGTLHSIVDNLAALKDCRILKTARVQLQIQRGCGIALRRLDFHIDAGIFGTPVILHQAVIVDRRRPAQP
ncbi:hypothetical protein D3C73_1267650 [compost metagenome]